MNKTPTHYPLTSAQHPGQVQIRGNEGDNTDELLIAVIADSSPYYGQGSNGAPFYISLQISPTGHIWRGGPGTRYRTEDLIFLFPIPNMAGGYRPLPGQANQAEFRTIDARGTRHGTRRHAA